MMTTTGDLLLRNVKTSFFAWETVQPEDGDKKVNEHDCSDESLEQNLKMAIRRLMNMIVVMRA